MSSRLTKLAAADCMYAFSSVITLAMLYTLATARGRRRREEGGKKTHWRRVACTSMLDDDDLSWVTGSVEECVDKAVANTIVAALEEDAEAARVDLFKQVARALHRVEGYLQSLSTC
ncbi:hypothetical protein EDB86DRAFT_2828084 [Lactarius hatsudake]|nr:hypothetical protein EDB86DRAFT_2828084 [Lactarius hatsudake]